MLKRVEEPDYGELPKREIDQARTLERLYSIK